MSWYSVGEEAAEAVEAANQNRKSRRNFFTQEGESARIRFLKRASESFNYKRGFVKWAQGEKLLTVPDVAPNPFLEAGLTTQIAFAWPILDKRIITIKDKQTGEDKEIGPRILYFADGTRTRKQLIAFEKEMLAAENESRQEEGKEPLTLDEYNLTHYDIKASKPKGSPWNFVAVRSKPELTKAEQELVEKYPVNLEEELKPKPIAELRALLRQPQVTDSEEDSETIEYSYSADDDDVVKLS